MAPTSKDMKEKRGYPNVPRSTEKPKMTKRKGSLDLFAKPELTTLAGTGGQAAGRTGTAPGDVGKWILAPTRNEDSYMDVRTFPTSALQHMGGNVRTGSRIRRISHSPIRFPRITPSPQNLELQSVSGGSQQRLRKASEEIAHSSRPLGSIESLGLQPPHLKARASDLDDLDTDDTGHGVGAVRPRRPTAPKPRVRKMFPGSKRDMSAQSRAISTVSTTDGGEVPIAPGEQELATSGDYPLTVAGGGGGGGGVGAGSGVLASVKDEISISPGVDAAWKESWVLDKVSRHSLEKLGATIEDLASITDSMQIFANYKETDSQRIAAEKQSDTTEKPREVIPERKHPTRRPRRNLARADVKKESSSELLKKTSSDTSQRHKGSAQSITDRRPSVDEDEVDRVRHTPSKEGAFLASESLHDLDQVSEGQKFPLTKYCPWHPRPQFDAWMSQKSAVPSWLKDEAGSHVTSKPSKKLPSEIGANLYDLPSCCQLDVAPGREQEPPTRKKLRPEVVRWLQGYPVHTRFFRETHDLKRNPISGVVVEVDETNPRRLLVRMEGPPESSYEGGVFQFEVFFPGLYPNVPPKIRFMTKIFHPNIDKLGRVRMPMIEEKWTPAILIRQVFESLQDLLLKPNLSDPMAVDVARRWFWHEPSAKQTARVWTKRFAHAHQQTTSIDCNCKCFCDHQPPGCPM